MTPPSRGGKPWRRPLRAVNHEPAPFTYRVLARIARVLIPLVARRHWTGQEHIPATGGALVAANHVSNADPVLLGEFLVWSGRWPRYLGKHTMFEAPVLGFLVRATRQIPVYRDTPRAKDALVHAREALVEGGLVVIYPEGTITADPDGWPMRPHTGVARLALSTGVPVIPIGQFGAASILGGRELDVRRLFSRRRRDVSFAAGPPLDLTRFETFGEPDKATLEAASTAIMDAITDLVAGLRGEPAPEGRFDIRTGARVPRADW